MQNKSRIGDRASIATKALETAWGILIKLNHRIPYSVVTLLTSGDRKKKKGHLSHLAWKYRDDKQRHEVGISPDYFHDPCYLPRFIFRERGYCLHGRITGAIRVARLAGLEIDLVKITKTYQETSF